MDNDRRKSKHQARIRPAYLELNRLSIVTNHIVGFRNYRLRPERRIFCELPIRGVDQLVMLAAD